MFFDFQIRTPVSINLYACLYSHSIVCVDKPKENPNAQFICQLSQNCWWYPTVMQTFLLCIQTFFLLVERLFNAKVLPNGHALTENYVILIFQSEATKNNSHR